MPKRKKSESLIVSDSSPSPETAYKIIQKHQLPGCVVVGKTLGQKKAIEVVQSNTVSFLYGTPGTGKSHISTAIGLRDLLQSKYQRLIITRPYLEAGEKLGFLPGDFNNKIAPFMAPVVEIISELIGKQALISLLDSGNIMVMPLAYMRGVTYKNSFVVMDEAQNTTVKQMRMILTRIGENSKLVVNGDTEQSDLYFPKENGLIDAISRLTNIKSIGFHQMTDDDCVRSPLVAQIDKLYREQP